MHNLSFRNELQLEESIYVCLPDVIAVTEVHNKGCVCLPWPLPSWLVAWDDLHPAMEPWGWPRHGAHPLCAGSGPTQCALGHILLQHIGLVPPLLWASKNPFSFLTQALRYGEAFLSGVVGLGILPWEGVNFLNPGVCICTAVIEVLEGWWLW